jgi:hypothetical protein
MTFSVHRHSIQPGGFVLAAVILSAVLVPPAQAQDPNDPGFIEPVLTETTGVVTRVPHTDQANGQVLNNVVGSVLWQDAESTTSLLGHPITHVESPNDDMHEALKDLVDAAEDDDGNDMRAAAQELMDILMGTTQGRIYDGFAMLNFNRGAFAPGHEPGEYKMRTVTDTGLTEIGIDGQERKIWETDVAMLYYDGQIDADIFLLKFPADVHEFDTVRIHYTVYSLEREDFSPTVVTMDRREPGSVQFPYKGLDSVWLPFGGGDVMRFTMALPPNRLLRGIYTWGWRVHPPRIQFIQPIWEHVNVQTGQVALEPQGRSYAFRNRELSLDGIGDAAPEKKMYEVAKAALDGASTSTIEAWTTQESSGPRGVWDDWTDLAEDQRQLPPEAWDVLAQEDGLQPGDFGPYRFVSVFMNNEMYGSGPEGNTIEGWEQGDRFRVKLINLDDHTHYFRNVDFGPTLHDDIRNCCGAGSHSFEIMNFKPTYGAPKVAEVQWRAGWGFRPHLDVLQQDDVFSRPSDQQLLASFTDGDGASWTGWQYSATARQGDFRFNPPPFIIGSVEHPAPFPLREGDGSDGLVIGQHTEGYGVARMCPQDAPGFCQTDFGPHNPHGVLNFPAPNDPTVPKTELRFPPFLRNPDQGGADAGDIIPPTPAWKPFLWINPYDGSLYIDENDPSQGYWVDLTYAHGTPVFAGQSLDATVEAPRGSAQVFYQFDDLFHDNDIFSPHPNFQTE